MKPSAASTPPEQFQQALVLAALIAAQLKSNACTHTLRSATMHRANVGADAGAQCAGAALTASAGARGAATMALTSIERESLNKATEEFLARGGQSKVLPAAGTPALLDLTADRRAEREVFVIRGESTDGAQDETNSAEPSTATTTRHNSYTRSEHGYNNRPAKTSAQRKAEKLIIAQRSQAAWRAQEGANIAAHRARAGANNSKGTAT